MSPGRDLGHCAQVNELKNWVKRYNIATAKINSGITYEKTSRAKLNVADVLVRQRLIPT